MAMLKLEEVFKVSGIPTHTFVRPLEYNQLIVALRTKGRGVVIEGPSGIGKTTAVSRALEELGDYQKVARLQARNPADIDLIRELPKMKGFGVAVIDDFHRLPRELKAEVADLAKLLADEERDDCKLILVGINKAGESLIKFAHDLNNRLDILSFETNPEEKVTELITLGEKALNISINVKSEIIKAAHGSFYIAQMLSHQACIDSHVLEEAPEHRTTAVSFEGSRGKVFERLSRTYKDRTVKFARGPRFRREGRAPYLHLLHLLAQSEEWSLNLGDAIAAHPGLGGSFTQLSEKGYLQEFISNNEEFSSIIHYDEASRVLSVEDPQYIYFLRNVSWSQFPDEVGFLNVDIESKYDFALSFAGADRNVAQALTDVLEEMEFSVFYDENEQHRILAENVEDYLRPIYQSDARYIVALLGPEYPKRIWTKFESDHFRERINKASVIPVWFTTAPPGLFDETRTVGGFTFDPTADMAKQIDTLADLLRKKAADERSK